MSSCLFFVSISHIATNDFSTWRFVFAAFDFVAAPRTVFLWFFAKRKLDSTAKKGIQLAGCSRETLRLDSTLEFAGEFNKHLTDWLGVRAPHPASSCLVLADFLICNTPGRCLPFGGGRNSTRFDSRMFAYLLARLNKLSVRAVIVNYILRGSYAGKSVN